MWWAADGHSDFGFSLCLLLHCHGYDELHAAGFPGLKK